MTTRDPVRLGVGNVAKNPETPHFSLLRDSQSTFLVLFLEGSHFLPKGVILHQSVIHLPFLQ